MRNSLLALIALIGLSGTVVAQPNMMPDADMGMDDMEMPDFDSPEMQQLIEQLQAQFKKMEEGLSPEKREQLQKMQENTQKIYDALDNLSEENRTLEQDNAEMKAENKELKKEIAELQAKIDELQQKIQTLLKQKQQLANALEETSDVLAAGDDGEQPAVMTEEEKQEARKKISDIDEQITATQLELEEVKAEHGARVDELTERRDARRKVKTQIKEKKQAIADKEKELEDEQAQGEDIFNEMDFSSTFDAFQEESGDGQLDEPEPFADDNFEQQDTDVDQFALEQQG